MGSGITARDLWPIVVKLTHEEQVRLAKLALKAALSSETSSAEAYRASPPTADEFSVADEPLSWEADGWEELDAPR